MAIFALLSALVCLAAAFSLISHRLRLPTTVGVMLLSLATSTLLAVSGRFIPGVHERAAALVGHIDFSAVVLHGMLAYLLFAGALQLNLSDLSRQKSAVAALSTFGTVLSTVFVAAMLKVIFSVTGLPLGFVPCLLFGALISPTDPIAVLEMLRRVGAPASLEAQLGGESLFNDGVGAVLFLTLLESFSHGGRPSVAAFSWLLLVKAGGGIAMGLALGYLAYRLLRLVDSYRVEELLTLALAMGGYALADWLRLSAPLEAVAAGLMVGSRARHLAMTPMTQEHVDRFWRLIDDMLNVILFLLLGLELLVMPWSRNYVYAGLLAIPVVLAARWLSVIASLLLVRRLHKPARGAVTVLTWGGLRGALAVALALSLAAGPAHDRVIAITYIVVIFSIVVQGLTMDRLLRRLGFASEGRAVAEP
ncbi:MAG TPA: sodium:proton antiporter [Acidobacteriaceae bacterium]|jgi:CPA1 family monovalent cation:H+ antiporter|nr:sodium:proton antiporter [Acidobacteriaceae bacterium]